MSYEARERERRRTRAAISIDANFIAVKLREPYRLRIKDLSLFVIRLHEGICRHPEFLSEDDVRDITATGDLLDLIASEDHGIVALVDVDKERRYLGMES